MNNFDTSEIPISPLFSFIQLTLDSGEKNQQWPPKSHGRKWKYFDSTLRELCKFFISQLFCFVTIAGKNDWSCVNSYCDESTDFLRFRNQSGIEMEYLYFCYPFCIIDERVLRSRVLGWHRNKIFLSFSRWRSEN